MLRITMLRNSLLKHINNMTFHFRAVYPKFYECENSVKNDRDLVMNRVAEDRKESFEEKEAASILLSWRPEYAHQIFFCVNIVLAHESLSVHRVTFPTAGRVLLFAFCEKEGKVLRRLMNCPDSTDCCEVLVTFILAVNKFTGPLRLCALPAQVCALHDSTLYLLHKLLHHGPTGDVETIKSAVVFKLLERYCTECRHAEWHLTEHLCSLLEPYQIAPMNVILARDWCMKDACPFSPKDLEYRQIGRTIIFAHVADVTEGLISQVLFTLFVENPYRNEELIGAHHPAVRFYVNPTSYYREILDFVHREVTLDSETHSNCTVEAFFFWNNKRLMYGQSMARPSAETNHIPQDMTSGLAAELICGFYGSRISVPHPRLSRPLLEALLSVNSHSPNECVSTMFQSFTTITKTHVKPIVTPAWLPTK
ncbi:suppressor of cytokine signaling 5 motif protein [Ranid herpesvirus 3]|uniref:Suppressor of cytokine signaling 5 motif protein n=1 Tax=Ranid herpesvirus 3 TaxID=1987509 RepID=A0A1X9T558_9VIRU|nr:suppressor of cytokine signaling 5 motif protein [Ranid herpesvirus 3]ARR28833.1 suppressor of cytokine signaling 5 motif protein [Ranid herpesvirus 3]